MTPELLISVGGLAGLVLLMVPPLLALARRRRERGVVRAGEPAQYSPPDDVTAAELIAAWRGPAAESDASVLVATLVDLSARGALMMWNDDGLVVLRTGAADVELRPWEADLLDGLVPGDGLVAIRSSDRVKSDAWRATYRRLVEEAEQSGRRNPRGDRPDRRWAWLSWLGSACLGLAILAWLLGAGVVNWCLIPLGVGALAGGRLARAIAPRTETAHSAQFAAQVRGFRRVLDGDDAAARREFAQRLGRPPGAVMSTMLPYAIVFRLEKSWLDAFPDLTPDDVSAGGLGRMTVDDIARALGSAVGGDT